MNVYEELKKLSKDLNSNLKELRSDFWGVWILCIISLLALGVGIALFSIQCLDIEHRGTWIWIDLILAVFSIGILAIIAYGTCQFLFKSLAERQQENKKWQTRLIDAYGKLLEDKLRQHEMSEEEKKKKEEREADLDKKKHELEIAKLNYEIEKYEYKTKHINEV